MDHRQVFVEQLSEEMLYIMLTIVNRKYGDYSNMVEAMNQVSKDRIEIVDHIMAMIDEYVAEITE